MLNKGHCIIVPVDSADFFYMTINRALEDESTET
jgi:hypothetical protein